MFLFSDYCLFQRFICICFRKVYADNFYLGLFFCLYLFLPRPLPFWQGIFIAKMKKHPKQTSLMLHCIPTTNS